MADQPKSRRFAAVATCAVAVLACLGYASVRGQLPGWWRDNGGGIPYVVFWITFGFLLFPERKFISRIVAIAVVATCALEFLQLWQPSWVTQIRHTRLGAALLGNEFSWSDFPPYLIVGLIGFFILHSIAKLPLQVLRRQGD